MRPLCRFLESHLLCFLESLLFQCDFGFIQSPRNTDRFPFFLSFFDSECPRLIADFTAQNIHASYQLVFAAVSDEVYYSAERFGAGRNRRQPFLWRVQVWSVHDAGQRPCRAPDHLLIKSGAFRRLGHDDDLYAGVVESLGEYSTVHYDTRFAIEKAFQCLFPFVFVRFPADPLSHPRKDTIEDITAKLRMQDRCCKYYRSTRKAV